MEAIAGNQHGGSGFKRALLLKLIENGNLSPKDVGPAVTLLRNAIQEDQERRNFQTLKQAMKGDQNTGVVGRSPRRGGLSSTSNGNKY